MKLLLLSLFIWHLILEIEEFKAPMILPFCHTIDSSDQTDFFDGEKYAVASFEKDVALLKFVQTFLYCQQTSIVPNFRRNWTFQIVRPQAIKLSRGLRCSGNLWESVLNCIVTVAVCVWTNQGSLVTQFGRRRLCGNVVELSGSKLYWLWCKATVAEMKRRLLHRTNL